jgi:hypothetical protein
LPRGALELQAIRFAFGRQTFEFLQCHVSQSAESGE